MLKWERKRSVQAPILGAGVGCATLPGLCPVAHQDLKPPPSAGLPNIAAVLYRAGGGAFERESVLFS